MQNAPSSSRGGAATENREKSRGAAGASQNQHADQNKYQNQRADDNKNQRTEENMPGSRSKSMNSENEKNGKTEGQGRTHEMDAQTGTDRSHVTTGHAGSGANLSADQRTRITSIIRNEHVAPVNNADFAVSIGTRVPRERVSLRPLPTEVVNIYPEWRGHEFFLVHDQIVVVDPRTLEIVAVLDV